MSDYQDRLLRALVNTLKAISEKVEAIATEQARATRSAEPVPPREPQRVSAEVQLPQAEVNRYYTEARKAYRFQKWGFGVSFATLIVVISYTVASFGQWDAITEQLEQTQSAVSETRRALLLAGRQTTAAEVSAKVADKSLLQNTRSFQIDQRPYVIADFPIFNEGLIANQGITANITFRNIGKSPARKIVKHFRMVEHRESANRQAFRIFINGLLEDLRKKDGDVRRQMVTLPEAEEDIAPGKEFFVTNDPPVILSAPDLALLLVNVPPAGNVTIFYVALVTYTDPFEAEGSGIHETEFCNFYFGNNPRTWHICDSHNTIK